jgi:hypothetical protein
MFATFALLKSTLDGFLVENEKYHINLISQINCNSNNLS